MARPARMLSHQALVLAGRTQTSALRLELNDSTIWMRSSTLSKWLIVVVKIAKLISTHATRLAYKSQLVACVAAGPRIRKYRRFRASATQATSK